MAVAGPENKTPLTPEEETLLREQILPILKTTLPEGFVNRALQSIKEAAEQSKRKHGMGFGGLLPNSGQVGVAPISPRDFNLATTWTFRSNWSSSSWQTLISSQTTSKYTHIVVLAYEDLESVPLAMAMKETTGGQEHCIIDLTEIHKSDRQIQPIEPYIIAPISVYTLEIFLSSTGYDNFKPYGFTVAPYAFLVSKTFLS